jgi:hypothetical protein
MKSFKFFQNPKLVENTYLTFDMDEVLIHVLRYKQIHNQDIINVDTSFEDVNVPINGFMRILMWRTIDYIIPQMIEIDYRVVVANEGVRGYTYRTEMSNLLNRIEITGR